VAESEEVSTLGEVEHLAQRDPFVPFTIIMGSGERYDIQEHDTVTVGKSVVMVTRHREGHFLLRQNHISEVFIPGDGA
jgi:hypothetical protein